MFVFLSVGTNLPPIEAPPKAPVEHKTLAHALSRAATSGALELGTSASSSVIASQSSVSGMMGTVLKSYAIVQDKIGDARLTQDAAIKKGFLQVWQQTMAQDIQAAVKSRQGVRTAR